MSKSKSKMIQIIIAVAVVVIGAGAAAFKMTTAEDGGGKDMPTFEVIKGPLTISINESGTIKARDLEIIKSELEGSSTILWVVPEATEVKKGDVLVELDVSQLQDARIDQLTTVQNAETAAITAKEDLAVGENQAKADVDLAKLTLDFANLDLEKYTAQKGEYETQRTEAQVSIQLADEELKRAAEKLDWSEKLAKGNYISSMELQADQLAFTKAESNLKLAQNKLQLLDDFTYQRQLAQLKSDVSQAQMALDRVKRSSAAKVIQLKAELLAAESKYEREQIKLAKIDDQISKATIKAPADGMVVYASSAKGSWRGNQEPLEEGQSVHEREELIYLPTSDAVKAEVKVHESSMDKVRRGLPVVVTVDALPGKTFTGKVEKIALLPDAQSMWMNPDLKIYATEIFLDGESKDLRTGMSCRAEIVVDHYEDVMFIPVQAVVRIGKQQTVYVEEGDEFKERKVEIGLDNNRMVHVKSGLEPGELVLLTPPLAPAEMKRSVDIEGLEIPKAPPAGQGGAPGGMREGAPGQGGARPGGAGQRPGGAGQRPAGGGQRPMGAGGARPGGGGGQRPAGGQRPGQSRGGAN